MTLPRARRDDVLTTYLDDEVVVYDPETKHAHSLNRVAVAVWEHSDGTKTLEELQTVASAAIGAHVSVQSVQLALRRLERAHLILDNVRSGAPITRREALGKAGKFSAAAMMTPLIASALVQPAAAAGSAGACIKFVCGQVQFCSPGGCLCTLTTEGDLFCSNNFACGSTPACPGLTSAECPPGFRCQAAGTGCCGQGVCLPPCSGGTQPSGAGTNSG